MQSAVVSFNTTSLQTSAEPKVVGSKHKVAPFKVDHRKLGRRRQTRPPLAWRTRANRRFSFSLSGGSIYAPHVAKAAWNKSQHYIFCFFWFVFYHTLPLKSSCTRNCLSRSSCHHHGAHLTAGNWIGCRLGLRIKRRLFVSGRKGGGEVDQAWPRREGSRSLLCMHGGFCGRRSRQAPQCCLQLPDNRCSDGRDVLRALRHVFSIPPSLLLPQHTRWNSHISSSNGFPIKYFGHFWKFCWQLSPDKQQQTMGNTHYIHTHLR